MANSIPLDAFLAAETARPRPSEACSLPSVAVRAHTYYACACGYETSAAERIWLHAQLCQEAPYDAS